MKATWKNTIIAESDNTIIIEGNHYFPPESVNKELITDSDHVSECAWKGTAHYYNVVVRQDKNENAAWYYPIPKDGSIDRVKNDFTNYVAFWNGIEVGD